MVLRGFVTVHHVYLSKSGVCQNLDFFEINKTIFIVIVQCRRKNTLYRQILYISHNISALSSIFALFKTENPHKNS